MSKEPNGFHVLMVPKGDLSRRQSDQLFMDFADSLNENRMQSGGGRTNTGSWSLFVEAMPPLYVVSEAQRLTAITWLNSDARVERHAVSRMLDLHDDADCAPYSKGGELSGDI